MDILVEIFLEIYMELMLLIVPEKNMSKKHIIGAKIIAVSMLLIVLALAVFGLVLWLDKGNLWGFLPLGIAVVLSVMQIVLGIVLYKKRH